MLRFLPVIIHMALLVYALIDCIQTESIIVRNLDKTMWVFIIILVPVVGPIAWLVAGRPASGTSSSHVPWRSTATAGFPEYERPAPRLRVPDDLPGPTDPDPEKEWLLQQWQAQLDERERAHRALEQDGAAEQDGTAEPRPA